jgi:hypothetical protein
MKTAWAVCLAFLISTAALGQTKLPLEANSHITVLVDLSGTWLNDRSKAANKRELETVAATIASLVASAKPPTDIQYLEMICAEHFSDRIAVN